MAPPSSARRSPTQPAGTNQRSLHPRRRTEKKKKKPNHISRQKASENDNNHHFCKSSVAGERESRWSPSRHLHSLRQISTRPRRRERTETEIRDSVAFAISAVEIWSRFAVATTRYAERTRSGLHRRSCVVFGERVELETEGKKSWDWRERKTLEHQG